jgi:hypothetical protein
MDTPIACSLPPAEHSARRATIDGIARDSLRSREPIERGARFTFGADAEDDLRALIAAEAECCPFLRMALDRSGDSVTLEVTGPEEAQPLIAEFLVG